MHKALKQIMADYRSIGSVAVLELNNPPTNPLSYGVRKGLYDGIEKANKDRNINSIVLIGKQQHFSAGADITEFSQTRRDPSLLEVGDLIEKNSKPVVAAINGVCLGGGLELALFCHYRLAAETARFGFPEVNIGLLPGAYGTQRLPRVAGLQVALDMITTGKHVPSQFAAKSGIIDKIIKGNLLSESVKYASTLRAVPDNRRLRNVPVPNVTNLNEICEATLATIKQKKRGFIAPINCLKAVKAAVELPYDKGIKREGELFMELLTSSQARAQQYAFFSERAATKWYVSEEKNNKTCKDIKIKSAGVIGAGTMGSGIAVTLLNAGLSVKLVEQDAKNLQKGVEMIKSILQGSVRLKRMTQTQMEGVLQLLQPTTSIDSLQNVDLVIEAVFESLKLKQEIFGKLDQLCKPETILCSNTSTLDIDKIASATNRQDKVIGTHFFAPAYIMPLLENVYGENTSGETIATVMKLGKTIKKVPVLVKTCHGFVANRMMSKYGSECGFLLEEGCLPNDVDEVMEDFGMPMGSFKVGDLSGLDVGWRIRQEQAKEKGYNLTLNTRYINGERYNSLGDRLYEAGRLGRKTGKGWYRYEKVGGRNATIDPEVTSIILQHCRELNITRRKIPTQEIVERCIYAAINEGFRCLEEGIASKPEDIDVIWLYGFNPRYRGGPMFYASEVGLEQVYNRITYYHKTFPESSHWLPSDLLRKLGTAGQRIPISDWMKYSQLSPSQSAHSKL